jgi:putative phosphoesterase
MHLIGLVADTHGLIRPECRAALEGVELILHAGDVGDSRVLEALEVIAPVEAVAGNIDEADNPILKPQIVRTFDAVTVRVLHGHEIGAPTPEKLVARFREDVLIFGHTHKPVIVRFGQQLVVNPGAAGPRRFRLQPSVAVLSIDGAHTEARLISL